MTPEALRALELRQQLSKSSVKKLNAIVNRVADDDRIRYGYKFYGAHTGRWSAEGVQQHNFTRGNLGELYDVVVRLITAGASVSEMSAYGPPIDVISSALRGSFQAPDGYKFVVADLNSIETRVLAWLAQCPTLLDVFGRGLDPYIDFASFMYRKPYDAVTKSERQIAKPAVLGCGYQLSGGDWRMDCCGRKRDIPIGQTVDDTNDEFCVCVDAKRGDEFKSGLWGYAEGMGVPMTREQAHEAVAGYRTRYAEIVTFWYAIEDAAIRAVATGEQQNVYGLTWGTVPGKVLWVLQPSGRRLHYLNPQLSAGKYKRPSLTHYTYTTTGWRREQLYGGLITENLVQAIARDVLAEGMLRADGVGMTVVGHTHDEIICLEQDLPQELELAGLICAMTEPMPWAPDLPLAAEGYESKIYRK